MRFLQHLGNGCAINGSDDEQIHAFGDHVLDLGYLVLYDILAVLQIRAVTLLLEFLHHVVAVIHPALR
ncbi:hypothetical protein D3C76_1764300 [compost metagenome]